MAQKQNVSVAAIVINFHQEKDTRECIASLFSQYGNGISLHVVLVDADGKADDQIFSDIRPPKGCSFVVLTIENDGFSGNNNVGLRFAQKTYDPDFFFLLNNDATIAKDSLSTLISFYEKHSDASLVVPKIYFEKGYEFHKTYSKQEIGNVIWYAGGNIDWNNVYAWHKGVDEVDHGQFDVSTKTHFATGCATLIPKKTYQRVGLFDPYYFLYLEDLDYSMRSKAFGDIWVVPDALVYHKNAGSSGGSGSDTHVYYQTRNRYYFGFKYASLRTKLALLREIVRMIKHGSSVQREAVRDFLLFRGGKRGGLV